VASDPLHVDRSVDRRPRSLAHMFLERVETTPDADAYYYPVEGGWQESTWEQTHTLVEGLAAGLVALGIEPEDRVAVMATSRYEWVLAFLAAQFAGAAVTPLDPAADDDHVVGVLRDSGARVVVAEDHDAVRTLWRVRARIRDVTKVVQIDGDYPDRRVLSLEGLLALGADHLAEHPRAIAQRLYAVRRQGLAAITYAPARDGVLRGVRLRHEALTYQGAAIASLGVVDEPDLLYLCLPLSGTFAQSLLAAHFACGFPVAIEGRPDRAITSLSLVRPTLVGLTPALLEQIRALVERENRAGLLQRRAADRAFEVARQVREREAAGEQVPGRLARRHRSLDRRVLSGVREVFGERLRFVVTTGGLDGSLAEFFDLAGVTVLEAYGRPETAGAVCLALPDDHRSGTAGRPLPGTRVRVAEDGEILVSGPGLMEGYHQRRRDTARALEQGWWHSGDSGVLDAEGRLRVLGRLPERASPE
jgi:long-chain acyl-CoA synthetase